MKSEYFDKIISDCEKRQHQFLVLVIDFLGVGKNDNFFLVVECINNNLD